jgi:hypothetical protein
VANKRFLVLHNDKGEPMAIAELDWESSADTYMLAKMSLFDKVLDAFNWFVRETGVDPEKGGKRCRG